MKLLVTGTTGFIGNYYIKHSRYKEAITPFSFRNDNITLFDFTTVDTVAHLAALVHQMNGADSQTYHDINVTKTVQLAHKAKENGVKQFIFISSVKVYGEESDSPYTEITPCNPSDDYGKSKLLAEQELLKLQSDQFIVTIIRTPIVYGTGVKANIKNLISLIRQVPFLPFKGIHNQRSMVYVGNLCHLIDTIIEQKQEGVFLATDDTPISTTDLIILIAREMNKTSILIHIPFFSYLLKKLKPLLYQRLFGNLIIDNTQTKRRLNFKNLYTTEEGIKQMISGNDT